MKNGREKQSETENAMDYTAKLTSLRKMLLESIADPRRYDADEVRANLKAHFAAGHPDAANLK